MRTIEASTRFKKDFARWIRGTPLAAEFDDLLRMLASGAALPPHYRDHPLQGPWRGHRDCHLRSDVVLIYERGEKTIRIVRIGSHSELFGG
ncbi:MAG: type II toxin-antitoxin system YafQ family toxin [Opitutales bacterium]